MNTELLNKVTAKHMSKKLPDVKVGQTVQVDTLIRDGDKTRIQKFAGLVIAIKGSGINRTFTVRKISNGYGVEKIFPFYSPTVQAITILKEEKVRRSKLYFMRDRIGKAAMRVRKGRTKLFVNTEGVEEQIDAIVNDEIVTDEVSVDGTQVESDVVDEVAETEPQAEVTEAETVVEAKTEVVEQAPVEPVEEVTQAQDQPAEESTSEESGIK